MQRWQVKKRELILTTKPFAVEEVDLQRGETPLSAPFYRLECPPWVNICALTEKGEVVLVRQFRAGSLAESLETPGGMVDPGEEPRVAAERELEEETGWVARRWHDLGACNPNPALFGNAVHFFLAEGCYQPAERRRFPDPEEWLEVVTRPFAGVRWIDEGTVSHALSLLCLALAAGHREAR